MDMNIFGENEKPCTGYLILAEAGNDVIYKEDIFMALFANDNPATQQRIAA